MEALDRRGRPLRDLRISVTDRCNLRCTYCMPREHFGPEHAFLPKEDILRFEDIADVVEACIDLGLQKIRITGGEPLLRRDLDVLVAMLRNVHPSADLALTTNGVILERHAERLLKAGLDRVTVSMDALSPTVYSEMGDVEHGPEATLAGIAKALDIGLRVKVNCVVRAGVNEGELLPLLEHFGPLGVPVRFIEFMDVGATNQWALDEVVTSREVRQIIASSFGEVTPLEATAYGEVARRWQTPQGWEFGTIDSISAPFCGNCTRARLAADGSVHTCLFSTQGSPLMPLIKSGASKQELSDALRTIWTERDDAYSEQRGAKNGPSSERVEMSYIGG
ncbi:MAG: GTP 3',8-cyclase MoaA [Euryarchaeota archaeon TMED141]|nr:MAG: GTP 3',8-cyclase MoaA [Euryarchaeota archaeon TMED141]DAC08182.1 MAG TPA: GTP 3',8-cyclase MoaA [Candidatus Poseidoniales archaeon]HII19393.1 GTP 3',8-cyclase MoaA [Candidatus Poseidoniaceae archaeon]